MIISHTRDFKAMAEVLTVVCKRTKLWHPGYGLNDRHRQASGNLFQASVRSKLLTFDNAGGSRFSVDFRTENTVRFMLYVCIDFIVKCSMFACIMLYFFL
jgi:hypothetical protein